MEYKDHALEQDFHSTLHKAKRYSRKKKKHLKDDSRWVESNKYLWNMPRKRSLCGCERCKDNMQHKHLRAKRVYVEEEYDEEAYYRFCDITRNEYYLYERMCYEDLLLEGWTEYLGAGGEVLFNKIDAHSISPIEIKDYNYCAYCENHHFDCECFE